jgi:hypothetical protein
MKKHLFSILITILYTSTISFNAYAIPGLNRNSDTTYKNNLKLELLFGGIQFEKMVHDKGSIQLSIGYSYHQISDPNSYSFHVIPEYRFYPMNKQIWPTGIYIGSFLYYKDFIVARDIEQNNMTLFSRDKVKTGGIGVNTGYQWFLGKKKRMTTNIEFGFGYNIFRNVNHLDGFAIIDEDTYNFNFIGGITLGYAF